MFLFTGVMVTHATNVNPNLPGQIEYAEFFSTGNPAVNPMTSPALADALGLGFAIIHKGPPTLYFGEGIVNSRKESCQSSGQNDVDWGCQG